MMKMMKMMKMSKRRTKFYRKNEAEVMERLGFSPVANSGAGWISKEDGESDKMLCQLKSTDKESISIKQHDLHTLEIHAAESHKLPVFAFQFLNRDEVWLAVKESDIEAFKSILKGEEMHYPKCFGEYQAGKCDRCLFWDECKCKKEEKEQIDETEEIGYNYNASESSVREAIEARKRFYRESQKEKEETEKRFKEKVREKRNRCRKKK